MNIKKIIERGESETVEFKPSLSQTKDIVETVSALSNTKGGLIVIGVNDEGKLIGVEIGSKTIENLANSIKQNTDPEVYPSISLEKINGKNVIIIEVDESKSKPVFAFDRVYKRVGKSNHRVSSEEIRKLARESEEVYWDERICKDATLEDIDEEKVNWFLRKAKYERNFDVDTETPVKEALKRLKLMKGEKLTNAAVLLFGKSTQKFFLQAETRCARFKGTEPVKPFVDMKVFGGSVIDQADKALNFVLDHIPMAAWLIPGQAEREERYEYPPDAIREAIINAICHRDYSLPSNVQVRIFDDRIEVWGCGPLPRPLTPEDLKREHKSILRNPLIGRCFFLIRFIERWGTGTNEIIKKCLDWGLPEPEFDYVAGDLVVTFRKSKLTEELMNELGLNERQKRAIDHLKEHSRITTKEYCKIFKVARDTANRDMNELLKKGLIERKGSGPRTYYVLSTVRYRPISSDTQTEEKFKFHLQRDEEKKGDNS